MSMDIAPRRDDIAGDRHPPSRTATAFLLSPGLAALLAPITFMFDAGGGSLGPGLYLIGAFCFAVVGYATTLVLAVPLYVALPERVRGSLAAVVPLAGAVAATPWILFPIASDWRHPDLGTVPLAFGLGCVAGLAFSAIRRVPDEADAGAEPRRRFRRIDPR